MLVAIEVKIANMSHNCIVSCLAISGKNDEILLSISQSLIEVKSTAFSLYLGKTIPSTSFYSIRSEYLVEVVNILLNACI